MWPSSGCLISLSLLAIFPPYFFFYFLFFECSARRTVWWILGTPLTACGGVCDICVRMLNLVHGLCFDLLCLGGWAPVWVKWCQGTGVAHR